MTIRSPSPLKSHLGFWLRLVSNQVSHSFARKVEASGATVAEWVILRELFDIKKPVSPSVIAQRTRLSRGAVSKLVDRLVAKGFVNREGSDEDRRYQTITLTKTGAALVPKLSRLADDNDSEFFDGLTTTEKNTLLKTLQKIVEIKNIDQLPTE